MGAALFGVTVGRRAVSLSLQYCVICFYKDLRHLQLLCDCVRALNEPLSLDLWASGTPHVAAAVIPQIKGDSETSWGAVGVLDGDGWVGLMQRGDPNEAHCANGSSSLDIRRISWPEGTTRLDLSELADQSGTVSERHRGS